EEAARFSRVHKSLFSRMLQSHSQVAITTLERLSKTQARQFAKALARLNGLPWKIVIIIDSTLQHRASLYPENAKSINSRIKTNTSALWNTFVRSPWRTILARMIGVRSWCWPIVAMTTKRSRRLLPIKAGISLLPWG